MRASPVDDGVLTDNGVIREDGRMVYDMYLAEVKAPGESSQAWDYYSIVRTIPGDEAYMPLSESSCPLVGR
jgi:branched-chain amino acid transport system substrate-binding protein